MHIYYSHFTFHLSVFQYTQCNIHLFQFCLVRASFTRYAKGKIIAAKNLLKRSKRIKVLKLLQQSVLNICDMDLIPLPRETTTKMYLALQYSYGETVEHQQALALLHICHFGKFMIYGCVLTGRGLKCSSCSPHCSLQNRQQAMFCCIT